MSLTLNPGNLLNNGKYRIDWVMSESDYSITYVATELKSDRQVVIKELFPKKYTFRDSDDSADIYLEGEEFQTPFANLKKAFLREARRVATLKHSSIIWIHKDFEENGTAYAVMEYVEGENLASKIKSEGRLSEEDGLLLISRLAEAVDYMHDKDINHLDISPANIVIRETDRYPILVDFAVAKQGFTTDGKGTPDQSLISEGYAPFEVYRPGGIKDFSPQTDIYSLAATFYFAMTGMVPPAAEVIMNGDLKFPSSFPKEMRGAIEKALSFSRKDRQESAGELYKELAGDKGKKEEAPKRVAPKPTAKVAPKVEEKEAPKPKGRVKPMSTSSAVAAEEAPAKAPAVKREKSATKPEKPASRFNLEKEEEAPAAVEAPKPVEKPKPAPAPKAKEPVKVKEEPKVKEAPKVKESVKVRETVKAKETPKVKEEPKVKETVKVRETVKVKETPKVKETKTREERAPKFKEEAAKVVETPVSSDLPGGRDKANKKKNKSSKREVVSMPPVEKPSKKQERVYEEAPRIPRDEPEFPAWNEFEPENKKNKMMPFFIGGALGVAVLIFLAFVIFSGDKDAESSRSVESMEAEAPAAENDNMTVENIKISTSLGDAMYTGEVDADGLPNGHGVAKWTLGEAKEYDGEWVHGKMEGKTNYTHSSGDTFVGTFKDNQYDNGRYTIASSGEYFVGTYKDGNPDKGKWYDKNGKELQ